ncbi:MAG: translocation/assembly module TamB domain-containing protein [Candidatus Eisenbacteria bacterium]|nr:translocation/assembly module TamB domain-containing protein [Candidatus Eisenbacteria bacterium]
MTEKHMADSRNENAPAKKGSRKKILGVVLIAVLAVFVFISVLGAILVTRPGILTPRLVAFLNSSVIATPDVTVGLSNVSVNAFSGLSIENFSLKYKVDGRWVEFIKAPRVVVKCQLFSLIGKNPRIIGVLVEDPQVVFGRNGNGNIVLPVLGKKKGGDGSLNVATIELKGARVFIEPELRDPMLSNLSAVGSYIQNGDKKGVLVKSGSFVSRGRAVHGVSGILEQERGRLDLGRLSFAIGKSQIAMKGNLANGKFEAQADLKGLELSDVWGAYFRSKCPVEGTVGGEVKASGQGGAATILFSLSGVVRSTEIRKLDGKALYGKGLLRLAHFSLQTGDGTLIGNGNLELSKRHGFSGVVDLLSVGVGTGFRLAGLGGAPTGEISGRVSFKGEFPSGGNPRCAARFALTEGSIQGVRLDSGLANVRYENERAVVESLTIGGEDVSFDCSGSVGRGGELNFPFSGKIEGRALGKFFKRKEQVNGQVAVSGNLAGDLSSPKLEMDGEFKDLRWEKAEAEKGHFSVREASLGREPSFWLKLGLSGCGFQGRDVGDLRLDCAYKEKLFLRELALIHGDTSLAVSGEISIHDGLAKGVLTGGSIIVGKSSWAVTSQTEFSVSKHEFHSDALVAESEDGSITVSFSVNFETKEMLGDVAITNLNLARLVPEKLGASAGVLNSRLSIAGTYDFPQVNCQIRLDSAEIGKQRFEQIAADIAYSSKAIQFKNCEFYGGRNKAVLSGSVFVPVSFGDFFSSVGWNNILKGDTRFDLSLSLDAFDLEELGKVSEKLKGAQGRGAFSLSIRGTPGKPQFSLNTELNDVMVAGVMFGKVSAKAGYEDGLLSIGELTITSGGSVSNLNGELPIEISLTEMKTKFRDRPMELVLKMPQSDFRMASLFLRGITSTSGRMSGNVELKGTPYSPEIFGALALESGTMRLRNRDELLRDIEVRVVFERKLVRITSFVAKEGRRGICEGSGVITLGHGWAADYDFKIKMTNFTITDNENYASRIDADLKIVPGKWPDGTKSPLVTGTATLRQTIVRKEFSGIGEDKGPDEESSKGWLYDVTFNVPGNFWIKNSDADLELSGALKARNGTRGLVLLGSMKIVRGEYLLIDSEFKITSGTLEFTDVEKIDPVMDITAVSKVAGEDIALHVTGKASKPVPEFSSAKGRSQSEIIELLAVRKYWLGEGANSTPAENVDTLKTVDETNRFFLAYPVGNYLLKKLERQITGKVEWVDVLEFSSSGARGFPSAGGMQVGVGKYLTPELYMKYSQGLAVLSQQDVLLEYRVSNLVFLNGRVAKKRVLKGSEEYEYNLDLRFKVEY